MSSLGSLDHARNVRFLRPDGPGGVREQLSSDW